MTIPSDAEDLNLAYRQALRDFCKNGNQNSYTRHDALLYSEYGDRPVGELVKLYGYDEVSKIQALSAHVFYQFQESWLRLLESYVSQYNPLENYSMKEEGTDRDKSIGESVGNTNTQGYHLSEPLSQDFDKDDSVEAFNPDAAEANYQVTSTNVGGTTTDKVTTYDSSAPRNLQESTETPNPSVSTMTETGQHGSVTAVKSDKGHSHKFQRSGNIGVMTATDMLKSDSEFWSANDFFSIIASNIASLVTNPYYE